MAQWLVCTDMQIKSAHPAVEALSWVPSTHVNAEPVALAPRPDSFGLEGHNHTCVHTQNFKRTFLFCAHYFLRALIPCLKEWIHGL